MKVSAPTIDVTRDDGTVLTLTVDEARELVTLLSAVLPAAPLAFRPLPIVDMPTAPPAFTVAADAAVPPIQGADGSGS